MSALDFGDDDLQAIKKAVDTIHGKEVSKDDFVKALKSGGVSVSIANQIYNYLDVEGKGNSLLVADLKDFLTSQHK